MSMVPTTGLTRGRPNPRYKTFAQRLRKARVAGGLHAVALSEAAGLGSSLVGLLEAGASLPRLPTVEKLARALSLSPGWLAYGLGDAAAPATDGPLLCLGLAARAKEARSALRISLREVERRAKQVEGVVRTGLSEGAIRAVERDALPPIDTIERLARTLAVSPAWLAFGTGPRELPRRGIRPSAPAASG